MDDMYPRPDRAVIAASVRAEAEDRWMPAPDPLWVRELAELAGDVAPVAPPPRFEVRGVRVPHDGTRTFGRVLLGVRGTAPAERKRSA